MTRQIEGEPVSFATKFCHGCKRFYKFTEPHNCAREQEYVDATPQGIDSADHSGEHQGTDPLGEEAGSGCGDCVRPGPEEQAEAERMTFDPGFWSALRVKTETFEDVFERIFDEAFDLLVKRQRKYGPLNVQQLGLYGVFSRLASDKMERLRRAMNGTIHNGVVVLDEFRDISDESVDDTLLDIMNYAAIMLALRRGVWGRPLAEDVM